MPNIGIVPYIVTSPNSGSSTPDIVVNLFSSNKNGCVCNSLYPLGILAFQVKQF